MHYLDANATEPLRHALERREVAYEVIGRNVHAHLTRARADEGVARGLLKPDPAGPANYFFRA